MDGLQDELVLPLAEETIRLDVRTIETGEAIVSLRTETRSELIEDDLTSETVQIDRVPMAKYVDEPPPIRQDGDVMIIPVIEEVYVKRLLLREELHVTRVRQTTPAAQSVELRRQTATVSRHAFTPASQDQETSA